MLWALGALVLILIAGAIALQVAISRNGPAVLDGMDRLAGGTREAKVVARIKLGESPKQKLILWGPKNPQASAAPRPLLLFVHGGSWRSGDPEDYGFLGRAFVPEGFIVALAGYRLYPDASHPAMLEDTARAIAWSRSEIAAYGGDPDRIVVMGHSAGAYNVVMAALQRQWLEQEGQDANAIAGVIGLSGPYDFYPFDSESTINSFGKAEDPEATQPVNHLRSDASPMLLIHGERDDLVKIRNTHELAKRLDAVGARVETHTYPAMNHNDPLIALAAPWRDRRDVVSRIAEFARKVTQSDKTSVPVQAETR